VTTVSHLIMVPFRGDGSGTGEVTWGQRNVWRMMEINGSARMVGGAMRLSDGTTLDNIVHLLSFIVSRHQSLRTMIRQQPDGSLIQVLSEAGEVALEVVDIADDEDPAVVARDVYDRFVATPIDIGNDWPVRMAVIRQHGLASHFAVAYPHIAIDGHGFEALATDLPNMDPVTGEHLAPRAGIQPMELAIQQASPAGRRQSAASMRYWEQLLRSVPPRQFNDSADPRDPRWWDATYDSRAAFLAVQVIAQRSGIHSGPILMAAYAVAIAQITGIHPSAVRTLVSNRFRPEFGASVSTLVQPGLCVIDVADCTLDEAATRAWRAQLAAGKNGYYDPRDLWALMDRVNQDRGIQLDLMCYFNDRRRAAGQAQPGTVVTPEELRAARMARPIDGGVTPTRDEILAALPLSTISPGIRSNRPDARAYLNINGADDTINYTLRVDTHALSPAEQETVLRTIEKILVESATDAAATTGITAGMAYSEND
jgi:condensation domain-containing protein